MGNLDCPILRLSYLCPQVTSRIASSHLCVSLRGPPRGAPPGGACRRPPARRGPLAAEAGRASAVAASREAAWRRAASGGEGATARQHDDGDDLRRQFHVLMLCNRRPLPPMAPVTDVNGPGFGFWAAQRPGFWVLGCAAARVLGFGVGPKTAAGGRVSGTVFDALSGCAVRSMRFLCGEAQGGVVPSLLH